MSHPYEHPAVEVDRKGFLFWMKRHVRISSILEDDEHGRIAGLETHFALQTLHERFNNIESVEVIFRGDYHPAFMAYQSFHRELEDDPKLNDFLIQKVPSYDLTFETGSGDLIRGYSFYFLDGERERLDKKPMETEALAAAKANAMESLREIAEEQA